MCAFVSVLSLTMICCHSLVKRGAFSLRLGLVLKQASLLTFIRTRLTDPEKEGEEFTRQLHLKCNNSE